MKQIILALALFFLSTSSGMGMIKKYDGTDLVGVWIIERDGYKKRLQFKEDGSYEFDTDGDSISDTFGGYKVSGIKLILKNDFGPKECEDTANFFYEIKDERLTFQIVYDTCPDRILDFQFAYHKITKP